MRITDKALDRVHAEKEILDTKIFALKNFLNTETCANLDDETSDLLRAQFVVMNRYSEILGQIIAQYK